MTEMPVRKRAITRDEILNAAEEVFLVDGYSRTSMGLIHKKVGGSKRTLYGQFKDKEDLFAAFVVRVSERILGALQPPTTIETTRGALTQMGVGYLQMLLSPSGLALYRTMVSEAHHFPELAQSFFENGPGKATRNVAVFLETETQKGKISVANLDDAAGQFLGMVRGDIHLKAVFGVAKPNEKSIPTVVASAVDIFLEGMS